MRDAHDTGSMPLFTVNEFLLILLSHLSATAQGKGNSPPIKSLFRNSNSTILPVEIQDEIQTDIFIHTEV